MSAATVPAGQRSSADLAALHAKRVRHGRELMAQDGLDGLLVYSRGHVTEYGAVEFLAGYTPVSRPAYAALTARTGPVLIVPTPADRWHAARTGVAEEIRVAGEGNVISKQGSLVGEAVGALKGAGVAGGRIGVAGAATILPAGDHQALRDGLPAAELVAADDLLAQLKAIKEPLEIDHARSTARLADTGFLAAQTRLREGVSPAQLGGAIRERVFSGGARDALIFVSAEPYFLSWPSEEPLRGGELVTVFVEIVGPSGYWVEVGGLLALGEPSPRSSEVAAACLEAASRAEVELHPGRTAQDVARAVERVAARHELRSGIWHGHGVGVDHDTPVIGATDQTALQAGMVLAVHPNFTTADEQHGASVVDTYEIAASGPQRLSSIPQRVLTPEEQRWAT